MIRSAPVAATVLRPTPRSHSGPRPPTPGSSSARSCSPFRSTLPRRRSPPPRRRTCASRPRRPRQAARQPDQRHRGGNGAMPRLMRKMQDLQRRRDAVAATGGAHVRHDGGELLAPPSGWRAAPYPRRHGEHPASTGNRCLGPRGGDDMVLASGALRQVPGRKTDVQDASGSRNCWSTAFAGELRATGADPGTARPHTLPEDDLQKRSHAMDRCTRSWRMRTSSSHPWPPTCWGRLAMLDALVEGTTDPRCSADLARGALRKKLRHCGRRQPDGSAHHAFC